MSFTSSTALFAQTSHPDSLRSRQLVRNSDLPAAGAMVIGVGASFLADKFIQRKVQSAGFQKAGGVRTISNAVGFLGDPGAIVFSALTYFDGVAMHSRPIASLGMYTGESVVLGGVIAETLKGVVGRTRPKVDSSSSHAFQFGKGFSNDDYGSFPSAETTIAFAAATGASLYAGRQWPRSKSVVVPAAFTAASLVGFSRLYKNEHWVSDVAAGAALGIASGVAMDRWNQAHPNNIWERLFLPKSVSHHSGTTSIRWSVGTL